MNTPTNDSYQPMTQDRAAQIAAVIGTSEAMTSERIDSLMLRPDELSEGDRIVALSHVFRIANAAIRVAAIDPTVYVEARSGDGGWLECSSCSERSVYNEETEEEDITHDETICRWSVLVKTIAGEPV